MTSHTTVNRWQGEKNAKRELIILMAPAGNCPLFENKKGTYYFKLKTKSPQT
jgi:hypothetical protein